MKRFSIVEVEIEATEKDGRNVTAAMAGKVLREHMLNPRRCTCCYGDGRCVTFVARVGKARDGGAG